METKEKMALVLAGSGTKDNPYTYGRDGSRTEPLTVIEEAIKLSLNDVLSGSDIHFLLNDQPFYVQKERKAQRPVIVARVTERYDEKITVSPGTAYYMSLAGGNFTAAAVTELITNNPKKSAK